MTVPRHAAADDQPTPGTGPQTTPARIPTPRPPLPAPAYGRRRSDDTGPIPVVTTEAAASAPEAPSSQDIQGSAPTERTINRYDGRGLVSGATAAVLIIAILAATLLGAVGWQIRSTETAARTQVPAVLTTYPETLGNTHTGVALVSFTTPDGTATQKRALVPVLANFGDTVPVWINGDGTVADQPLRIRHIAAAVAATALGLIGLGVLLTGRRRNY